MEKLRCCKCGSTNEEKIGQAECNFGCLHWICEECE